MTPEQGKAEGWRDAMQATADRVSTWPEWKKGERSARLTARCQGFLNSRSCGATAHFETWDRKTFCRSCAVHLNFRVRPIGTTEPTEFLPR